MAEVVKCYREVEEDAGGYGQQPVLTKKKGYAIFMNKDEALILNAITGSIEGNPDSDIRKLARQIYENTPGGYDNGVQNPYLQYISQNMVIR